MIKTAREVGAAFLTSMVMTCGMVSCSHGDSFSRGEYADQTYESPAGRNSMAHAPEDSRPYIKGAGQFLIPDSNYMMPVRMDSLRDRLPRSYAVVFNDSNKYQLVHAWRAGIRPIETPAHAFYTVRPIVKVTGLPGVWRVDKLTHSVPYMVPEAKRLIEDIGSEWSRRLRQKGLPPMEFRVTSLLRTKASVKKLRRVNRNAVEQSTHQYGTTFDITYSSFMQPGSDTIFTDDPRYKAVMAEILYDMRAADRCMVKYERKSPCFHITTIVNRK